jgi:hypothetical protein
VDPTIQFNINPPALSARFLRQLQNQLDVLRMLEGALEHVTVEQVAETRGFLVFSPSAGAELPFDDAKVAAYNWLQTAFMRDAIESTGLFLDECLSICNVAKLARSGKAMGEEINRAISEQPLRHHRLHFPQKLAELEGEFGVVSQWSAHAISLNKLRTCIVHRLGVVGPQDVDGNNNLEVMWRTTRLTAKGKTSGREILLDKPGILIEEESMVQMQFVDHRRTFALSERISLTAFDLYSTIVTLWSLGLTYVEAIHAYLNRTVPNASQADPAV